MAANMDYAALAPEMILAGFALALVPVAGWVRTPATRAAPAIIAAIGILVVIGFTVPMLGASPREIFGGTYAVDPFRAYYQLMLEGGALITLPMLASHFRGHPQEPHAPVAVLLALLGAMGLAGSLDLGLIVLFLQMVSFPAYLLVVLARTDGRAQEAALKYFIYGAVALAVMAYGLTFLYGLTGSLNLRMIGAALSGADKVWVAVALGFILVGFGFEITMVPFQFWAPDVFEGATAPAAGFISVVPKIAAFAILIRFLLETMRHGLLGWPILIAVLSGVTMTFGNLVALRQDSIKRMLAYSSIAQAGYVLMGVAVAARSKGAVPAINFYLLAYLLMNLGAFVVVAAVERTSGSDARRGMRGLGRRAPWPAVVLTLALLSLAGIPPLAGFAGKVFLLSAAINGGMVWLAVIAAINMTVGLVYYVRVIAEMYFQPDEGMMPVAPGWGYAVAMAISTLGTILFGVLPALALGYGDQLLR